MASIKESKEGKTITQHHVFLGFAVCLLAADSITSPKTSLYAPLSPHHRVRSVPASIPLGSPAQQSKKQTPEAVELQGFLIASL